MSSPGTDSCAYGRRLCDSVYAFHEPQEQVDVEIVFIHDLEFDGSKEAYWKTWLARDEMQDNCWPKTWLAEDFPHARILSLSYDANRVQTSTSGRMDLYSLGESLVQEMTLVGVGVGQHECPVLFVCHGFGGLVAKQIVVTADENFQRDKEVQNLLCNLRAFYFYATPHVGVQDDLAPWNPLATHGPCMRYLKAFSFEVGRLNSKFEQIRCEVSNNAWMCFNVGEMHATLHGGVVVPESSARQAGCGFFPLGADHFDICRPKRRIDTSYQSLTKWVLKVIKVHEDEQCLLLDLPNGLVGMDDKQKVICEKLGIVSIFGLVGMGGIGKTTISKSVYNLQARLYDKTCYFEDVRSKDVASVQKDLLLELCGVTVGSGDHVSRKQLESIRQCIKKRKVLIVIDDVEDSKTLEVLQVSAFQRSLGSGSRVIVTCRNRQVLDDLVDRKDLKDVEIMDVGFLNDVEALKLFRYHVFRGVEDKDDEMKDFEGLTVAIAKACCGLPLSLEVIGQHLRKQHVHSVGLRRGMWEEALTKLGEAQSLSGGDRNEVLWKRLMISYDDLTNDTKSMFLDFACFFCERSYNLSEQSIGWIWKSPTGLQNLLERSLIKVDRVYGCGRSFTMHDQLRDMGRRIVKDLSLKRLHVSLKKVTRLWEAKEIERFLEENEDSIIEGISLRDGGTLAVPQSQVDAGLMREITIRRFDSLRLLYLRKCGIEVVEFFLMKRLKELSWLCLDHVWTMDVPHAIEAIGYCTELRVLQIRVCSYMEELPTSLGNLVQLVELDLTECRSLRSLPREIGHLKRLKRLQLRGCLRLKEVPVGVSQLIDLEYLGLHMCVKLVSMVEFETKMDHLSELDLGYCHRIRVPFKSLGKLHQLQTLNMSRCYNLVIENPSESFGQLSRLQKLNLWCPSRISKFRLPLGIAVGEDRQTEAERLWNLVIESFSSRLEELDLPVVSQACFPANPKLKVLTVGNGFRLEELPASLGDLTQLESLRICAFGDCFLRKLPNSLCSLQKLEVLELHGLWALDRLPDKLGHMSSLRTLVLHNVAKMEELPASLGELFQLEFLSLEDCKSLKHLPESSTRLTRLSKLDLYGCDALEVTDADQEFLLQELKHQGCRISLPRFQLGSLGVLT